MASKFAEFLSENKIDPRRVLVSSRQIERLRPEDRRIRLAHKRGKKDDSGSADEGEKQEPKKRRSGRVVTQRLLSLAAEGTAVSGPAKQRLLRAVNRILEQKNKDPVDLRTLF